MDVYREHTPFFYLTLHDLSEPVVSRNCRHFRACLLLRVTRSLQGGGGAERGEVSQSTGAISTVGGRGASKKVEKFEVATTLPSGVMINAAISG